MIHQKNAHFAAGAATGPFKLKVIPGANGDRTTKAGRNGFELTVAAFYFFKLSFKRYHVHSGCNQCYLRTDPAFGQDF